MTRRRLAAYCGLFVAVGAASVQATETEAPLVVNARQRFPALTETEARFFAAVAEGRTFDLRSDPPDQIADDPARGADWPASRAISPDCIVWLCTSPAARGYIPAHGVRVVGARIDGNRRLELTSVDVPFGLSLIGCYLAHGIDFADSSFRDLTLNRSRLSAPIEADGLALARSFRANGSSIFGDVNLRRLHAGDEVDFATARIDGTVHLAEAKIAGDLRFTDATVAPPNAVGQSTDAALAINIDLAEVGGTVSLDGSGAGSAPFSANGAVRMVLAHIGGNLDCWNGHFKANSGLSPKEGDTFLEAAAAILANGVQVDGSVFLAHGTTVRGLISLRTARIEHYLNVYELADGSGPAFGAAAVDLRACRVGTLNCDTLAWTEPGRLALNGFQYGRIEIVDQKGNVETQLPLDDADFLAWLQLQSPQPFFPQTYEQLADVLQREGYQYKARGVLIEKERQLRERSQFGIRELVWYRIFGPLIGYGHAPLRGLGWLLGVWLVSAVVFAAASRRGTMITAAMRDADSGSGNRKLAGKDPDTPQPERLQPLIYSLDVILPIIDFGQASRWVPDRRRSDGAALQWFQWGLIVIGWILTTLVVAGITGLVRH